MASRLEILLHVEEYRFERLYDHNILPDFDEWDFDDFDIAEFWEAYDDVPS